MVNFPVRCRNRRCGLRVYKSSRYLTSRDILSSDTTMNETNDTSSDDDGETATDNIEALNLFVNDRIDRINRDSSFLDDILRFVNDDSNDDTNEDIENDGPTWNILPPTRGILDILPKHLIYPNFPHVYNWERELFTEEHLKDLIEVMNETVKGGWCMNPYIILYCMQTLYDSFCRRHSCHSVRNTSDVMSRAFGIGLLGYVKKLNCDPTLRPLIELPIDLATTSWLFLYSSIKLDDFLANVVPAMLDMPIIQNKCRRIERQVKDSLFHTALNNSFAFVSLTMQWLMRDIDEITPDTIVELTDIFKNFAVLGNYIMALPFSFFTPAPVVHQYLFIPDELELSMVHKLARHFMLGFRSVGYRDFKDKLDFQSMIPNYRYLDVKLSLFADSVGWTDERKGFSVADAIRCIKVLGIMPFDIIHRVKLNENVRRTIEDSIVKDFKIVRDVRSSLKDFFNLGSKDYEYFANCLIPKVIEKPKARDDSDSTDYADSSVEKRKKEIYDLSASRSTPITNIASTISSVSNNCVVCLSNEPNTIFLSCLHKACCLDCSARLDRCPLCRRSIVSRLSDWQKDVYERLQCNILRETFSMFEKIVIKSESV